MCEEPDCNFGILVSSQLFSCLTPSFIGRWLKVESRTFGRKLQSGYTFIYFLLCSMSVQLEVIETLVIGHSCSRN
jgi:hypothetical protein